VDQAAAIAGPAEDHQVAALRAAVTIGVLAAPAALVDHLALVAVISTMISTTTYRFDR
jgi:hypothetical protein